MVLKRASFAGKSPEEIRQLFNIVVRIGLYRDCCRNHIINYVSVLQNDFTEEEEKEVRAENSWVKFLFAKALSHRANFTNIMS